MAALSAALAALSACRADPPRHLVEVGGEHRFHLGDDPRFAAPDFDDQAWETVSLPAIWRVRTPGADVVGWHRFRFERPAPLPPTRLALDLGAVGWTDEVFLNGVRVGGSGRFDRMPRLGVWPRLYTLPDGALAPGTNVLAVRVRGVPLAASGLLAARIGIGDELELARGRGRVVVASAAAEGLLVGFLLLGWLLVAFFPKRGRAGRATLFLLAAITLSLALLASISTIGRERGWTPHVGANVVWAIVMLGNCANWSFIATITSGRLPRGVQLGTAATAAIAVVAVLWVDALAVLALAAMLIGVVTTVQVVWLLVAAVRARTPGALPIAVGGAVFGLCILGMFIVPDPFIMGLPLVYYGLVNVVAAALLALTRYVHEINWQVQRTTEYAIEAHTRERSRLARDLHDGLGQMLALLKLQMQRMGRKHEGEPVQQAFEESAEQVAVTIDELRRIARDLRPAPMEDRGFGEAVREYAAAMSRRSDLQVDVEGDYQRPLGEEVGDELYRIAQECLTNCLKHSGARRVVVTLAEIGDRYHLTVADDGRGLPAEASSGLGLATIRERSELLGGACTIEAASGGGTRVAVMVPRS